MVGNTSVCYAQIACKSMRIAFTFSTRPAVFFGPGPNEPQPVFKDGAQAGKFLKPLAPIEGCRSQ
jgi:hypothetical protein